MSQIHEILPRLMGEIGAISKTNRNAQQNYNFRSVEQALNVLSPLFAQHGITPSVTAHEFCTDRWEQSNDRGTKTVCHATLLLTVRLTAPDGSFVENTGAGEGCDYGGDKAANKAMSAAFKYAMFLGLCIPVTANEIADSDRDDVRNDRQETRAAKTKWKDQTRAEHFAYARGRLAAVRGDLEAIHTIGARLKADDFEPADFERLNNLALELIAALEASPTP